MLDNHYSFRLMTYNMGWGRPKSSPTLENVVKVIQELSPDILGLQEAAAWIDPDFQQRDVVEEITHELTCFQGQYYGPTISMRENFHHGRKKFIDAIFNDERDWSQGNGLLSRWNFARLKNASLTGMPQNIPIFQPLQFEGNRDTDPRKMLLARIKDENFSPFVLVTHLTTLVGERGKPEDQIIGKKQKAIEMREQQINNLLDVIREHLLNSDELIFLLGDFNAAENESSLRILTALGFVHLIPENNHTPTHSFQMAQPIDHIFVYPESRLLQCKCRIVDTPLTRNASDHLPVVADVLIKAT